MKSGIYNLLKARFLVSDGSTKNWRFLLFLVFLGIAMIANTHSFEQKVYKIADLSSEVKELRSEFVDRRSDLMKLKMESTIAKKMEARGIFPAAVPPQKIKIKQKKEKSFFQKLWPL